MKTDSELKTDVTRELAGDMCIDGSGALDVANECERKPGWNATRSDAEIADAIQNALKWDQFIPDRQIRASVADHGVVTLSGAVHILGQREEAERVVRTLEGVRCVINEIVIEVPTEAAGVLRATIKHALERRIAREVDRIAVEVDGDTVVLSGVVGSWQERRAVLGAAKGMPGVRRIDDRLRIGV